MTTLNESQAIEELHWQLGLLQTLDVGLLVLDRQYNVQLWNSFMEHHSGVVASDTRGRNLFNVIANLPVDWLKRKLDAVFMLKNPAYISWEQRPYLFRFKSYRPITGGAAHMYQNVSLIPLRSPSGEVNHIGILVYDVTDIALGKLQLQQANAQLKALSRQDGLTGLYNRAYWEQCLDLEFSRFARRQVASSLVLLDIDHFKAINDNYGHPAGDEVIRQLAALLTRLARRTDIVGRYGGEEFGVLLVDTGSVNAEIYCERLRRAAEALEVEHGGQRISFTISLGVAELTSEACGPAEWIEQADRALYRSKQAGRNRFTVYGLE
ncbi:GGDEF domain-containing protein [Marinobacterium arenosum]|uniref:GGDEF domain-containing protein n=1 Tax=Marinobacterium arenosum TaxID=2862496 RepID=UPI001C951097|nr:diguanylate cyclase [Marinobacterium arenosum]MBY4675800.1 diguanylate cyclase [Marinobacterium arenosum]